MIRVQKNDFSFEKELSLLRNKNENIGAISSFIGLVRDKSEGQDLVSMTLEHYPGMAEKKLNEIDQEAKEMGSS